LAIFNNRNGLALNSLPSGGMSLLAYRLLGLLAEHRATNRLYRHSAEANLKTAVKVAASPQFRSQ
jgi:hypothetical protein